MSHFSWYLARASGIVAWGLLAAAVVWGYILSTKLFARGPKPVWTLALHRFLGATSIVFVALHIAGLVGDTYVHFGPSQVLVPFAARWHPVATAWGVVALYMVIAIEITSLLMKRLPRAVWLKIHRSSFLLFVFATVHFVSAGTDARGHEPMQIVAIGVLSLTTFLLLVRVLSPRAAAMRARRGAAVHPAGAARVGEREEIRVH